jgi:hypothetical protein
VFLFLLGGSFAGPGLISGGGGTRKYAISPPQTHSDVTLCNCHCFEPDVQFHLASIRGRDWVKPRRNARLLETELADVGIPSRMIVLQQFAPSQCKRTGLALTRFVSLAFGAHSRQHEVGSGTEETLGVLCEARTELRVLSRLSSGFKGCGDLYGEFLAQEEWRFLGCYAVWLLVTANVVPSSPILVTLMMETLCSSETSVLHTA